MLCVCRWTQELDWGATKANLCSTTMGDGVGLGKAAVPLLPDPLPGLPDVPGTVLCSGLMSPAPCSWRVTLLWLCWLTWDTSCENLTGVKMLLSTSSEEGVGWGWAVQPRRVLPPLLGLFLYGTEGTNKLQGFQSQGHLTLHCRAPFCPLGICGWRAKARHFARVCTSTEQIITLRNKFLLLSSLQFSGSSAMQSLLIH